MRKPASAWNPASVHVDGNLDSDAPTWIMWAYRGRNRIDLAQGPLASKPWALAIARMMNDMDPTRWDPFILQLLPTLIQHAPRRRRRRF